ncbi:hypothetical protein OV203_01340 [Nannocystis sp. ILAH1]|uniref:zonular occludens toxin domain-containing protein n=1 Tax=Nannocystis sp. ILAH1 TaxID=2996789 RepID=UPI002271CAFD|nr:zonular occludens toxin domain-containing protein [Nannocystis sp. ILAH1]MCY0985754.1 hypothetical protein [Nannocystis sp. ILAH1]
MKLGVSAVLDIYELRAPERVEFVRLFLEALVEAPKELWHPTLVVIDEAHVFCPQKGNAESAQAVIDLATRGRKRGYCAVLATQRLSKLHKDAAAECNNKLVGRTALDVDIARAGDELGMSRADREVLRTLQPGEFFAFGPALSSTITEVAIGPVQTSHPRAGGRLAFAPPPPTATIRALLPQLSDLPASGSNVVAGEPDELARLKQELVHVRARVSDLAQTMRHLEEVLASAARDALALAEDRESGLASSASLASSPSPASSPASSPSPASPPSPASARPRQRSENPAITRPQQAILNALAWLARIRDTVDRQVLALMADASAKSSAFANNLGALRTRGLIDYPGSGLVRLTAAGHQVASPERLPTTSAELQEQVFSRLSAPRVRLLKALLEVHPRALEKEALAGRVGASAESSAFANNLGALRSLGLLAYPKPGHVAATEALFVVAKKPVQGGAP